MSDATWLPDHPEHEHSYSNRQKQLASVRNRVFLYRVALGDHQVELRATLCDGCLDAATEYMREYRAKTGRKRDKQYALRQRRALQILRSRHPDEYDAIMLDLRVEQLRAERQKMREEKGL